MDMDKLMAMCQKLGLEGDKAAEFIKEQQNIERDRRAEEREILKAQQEQKRREIELEEKRIEAEREQKRLEAECEEKRLEAEAQREEKRLEAEREEKRLEAEQRKLEAEREERERQRRHEFEMKKLELETSASSSSSAKHPKLPPFVDGKDNLDSYLQRFERFAETSKWRKDAWATSLSALLTGKALDVYSRSSKEVAEDYDRLKEALLKRYELTEDGYRVKFSNSKPEAGESPEQFGTRLQTYITRWVELSKTEKTYEGLQNLFVKEQFYKACFKELAVYLREKAPEELDEMYKLADQYLVAHNKKLESGNINRGEHENKEDQVLCYICKQPGHIASECKTKTLRRESSEKTKALEKLCTYCKKTGHEQRDCWFFKRKDNYQAACVEEVLEPNKQQNIKCCYLNENDENIKDNCLILKSGAAIPIVSSAITGNMEENSMPIKDGLVGNKTVKVLRDTGCSMAVIRSKLVRKDQYTGEVTCLRMIDNSVKRALIARIHVRTPYYTGYLRALCLRDAIFDLVIGNIPGALSPSELERKSGNHIDEEPKNKGNTKTETKSKEILQKVEEEKSEKRYGENLQEPEVQRRKIKVHRTRLRQGKAKQRH